MKPTIDIKNTMTNLAMWLASFGTFLAGLNITLLHLPTWVTAVGAAMVGLAAAINGYYGGKNNDGTKKTQDQLNAQVNPPK